MKKFFLILAAAMLSTAVASAQPRAIGLRLGTLNEISYQHSFGNNFLEADLSFTGFASLGVTGIYNFMIAQPNWTAGTWGFYAGPGITAGMILSSSDPTALLGVCGQVGLEYMFANVPLQLAIDWRPTFASTVNKAGASFGFLWPLGGLSIRYFF